MLNRLLICCLTVAQLAACSTTKELALPDGRNRVPVNTPATIEQYKAHAAKERAEHEARSGLERQLNDVRQDVAAIKSFIAVLPIDQDSEMKCRAGTPVNSRKRSSPSIVQAAAVRQVNKGAANETIEVREQSIVFRVMQPASGTRFDPSDTLRVQLLRAATDARMLDIRGRSDADVADTANQKVALERARAARQYLLEHGIAPAKIRVSAMAAGGFIAANRDDTGRARNRRVEIEAVDLDTSSYQLSDVITKGGNQ